MEGCCRGWGWVGFRAVGGHCSTQFNKEHRRLHYSQPLSLIMWASSMMNFPSLYFWLLSKACSCKEEKKKTSVMCQKKLKTMTWHLNVPNYILQCTVNTHKKVPVLCFVQLFYRLPWSFQTFTRTGPLKMGLTFNHCRLSEEPVWLSVANLLSSVIILCARRPPSVQLLSLNTNLNKKWQCFNESNHVLLTRNSVICTFRG